VASDRADNVDDTTGFTPLVDNPFAHQTIGKRTPCLVVDKITADRNIAVMADANPGTRLRPHVKAFKSTALARRLSDAGHQGFTCATLAEVEGMMRAGLGHDLLLANQTLDADHLSRIVELDGRLTVAVDSSETIAAATAGRVTEVLIDVFVGMPRCGCPPDEAGALATQARAAGLTVRGVMGYEGHLMMIEDRWRQAEQVAAAMEDLTRAAEDVGGEIISAGGTGTYDLHTEATEIQAGSYVLMDTDYLSLGLPFDLALWVEATIISVNHHQGWLVADAGLKAMAMDHGNPTWPFGDVWFCSDEHTTLSPNGDLDRDWRVGDRVRLAPAHVDPTVAKHERMWVVADEGVVDEWPVDLRFW